MKRDELAPYYRQVGSPMVRASVLTGETIVPPWPVPEEDAAGERWVGWLAAAWAERPVAEAVSIASPVLAARIEAVLTGGTAEAGQVRRMALALARYRVRLRGRATPFGVCAGVSSARFGPHLSARWTEGHQARTRPDAVWLSRVIARLEASSGLRRRLTVVINDQTVVRGERLVMTWAPHAGAGGAQAEVSVRLNPVVRTVMQRARSPLRVGDLIVQLAAEHPGAPAAGLEAMVGELVVRGILISSLRPPSTITDVLAHLLDQLTAADAMDLPETGPLVRELQAIHRQLQDADRATSWVEGRARRAAAERMRALAGDIAQPVAVDLRLGCSLVLPTAVAGEAARAAEALIRLSPAPAGTTSWREYHSRFLGQYGPGTPVAVDQLVDPTDGVGFPAHFAPAAPAVREVPSRDGVLLALAQQAALEHVTEVVLDERGLDQLAGGQGTRPVSPADLWVDVRAATPVALDKGDFTLGVCGFGRRAAHLGRFLDLLDQPDRQQITNLPTSVRGAVAAQLSFPPQQVRQENVQRVPSVLPDTITLAEYGDPSPHRIPVADLAVIAAQHRLYVVSLSRRRVVEPVLLHAGAWHTMPPLARLLLEIPRSAHAAVTSFDWGAAAILPFVPRLRYGRTILAPARWRVDPADLPGSTASTRDWNTALQALRARRRLPEGIEVGTGDRQLRLNLGQAMDRALLRAHLTAADGPLTVAEAPAAADYGWFAGRAHEIVVPLTATGPPDPPPAFLRGRAPLVVSEPDNLVVYAKLYGHPDLVDTILTEHLPRLLAGWDRPPRWWFVRYRHPTPHLRLRVHDPDHGRAAARVATWAGNLRMLGLLGEISFGTYRPETGRYGTGPAMTAAENLFAADSAAILAQLAAVSAGGGVHPHALTAASLLDLAAAVTGSASAGTRWFIDHPELATDAPPLDRETRRQTLCLADRQAVCRLPGGEAIAGAWAARAQAATRYAAGLRRTATRVTPASALTSLLHLHHNRALGIDAETEAVTHKLARAVALAHAARQQTEKGDAA